MKKLILSIAIVLALGQHCICQSHGKHQMNVLSPPFRKIFTKHLMSAGLLQIIMYRPHSIWIKKHSMHTMISRET